MSNTPKTSVHTTESKPLFGGKSTYNTQATRGSDKSRGTADTREGAEKAALSGLPSTTKEKPGK